MSDDAILADEDPREFHSPFDIALDWAALEAFKWLVLGHIVYVVGLAVAFFLKIPNGVIWMTPLFAAPLVWKGRGHRLWPKVLALIVGVTVAHYLGMQAAASAQESQGLLTEPSLLPGFVGGAVGAVVSMGLCAVFGLMRPGAATLIFALFGAVLLSLVGGLGVYLYLTTGARGDTFISALMQLLKIYTPWQIAFAYVMAKVLRPDG
ncbi:hypothetical protein IAG41_01850 [Sphingomonas sp. JC676]|uniref:hypothetical protein n=1 Tax=Sphingomonas sp. JC676 TaxID=2768065 RepID=UPI001657A5FA|nr:hypothetical protein [Sphingomonas sp. JC676]MBC9031125.1 hypothetical protein [Sphingomonas sp. JC676]